MNPAKSRAIILLDRVLRETPDVYLLALLSALAVRPDTGLLRTVRRRLGSVLTGWRSPDHPSGSSPILTASTEGRLWGSRLVAARGTGGFSWVPSVAHELRDRLRLDPTHCIAQADLSFRPADATADGAIPLFEAVRSLTHARHGALPKELVWEELMVGRLSSGAYAQLDDLLAEPLAVLMDKDPASPETDRATAGWIYGALGRLPARVWDQPMAWAVALASARHASPGESSPFPLPLAGSARCPVALRSWRADGAPGASDVTFAELVPVRRHDVGLERRGTTLLVHPEAGAEHVRLEVPATDPRIIEVTPGSVDAQRQVVLVPTAGPAIRVSVGTEEVELWTLDGRTTLLSTRPVMRGAAIAERKPHPLPQMRLIGRASAQARLEQWVESGASLGVLEGPPGSGRSALLGWLHPRLTGRTFVWRYDIDPDVLRSVSYLARELGHAGYWDLDDAIRGAHESLFIVLDGVDADAARHPELMGLFRAVRSSEHVRLIAAGTAITGEDDPLAGATRIRLGRLAPEHGVQLLQHVGAHLPSELAAQLVERAEGHALTLSLMGHWLATAEDPTERVEALHQALTGRDASMRVRWLVRRLMESLGGDALAALGEAGRHPWVRSAFEESYGVALDPPRGHVLEPLARLADDERDHRLRAMILEHAGDPRTVTFVQPGAMALFDALDIWNPATAGERSWRFWRSCGTVIGRLLQQPQLDPSERQAIVETLRSRGAVGDWRQQQVVSIAVTKSGLLHRAPHQIEDVVLDLWQRGLPPDEAAPAGPDSDRRVHPQQAWTMAKDLVTVWQARALLRDTRRVDDWCRGRLVLSLVQMSAEQKAELGRIDRDHPLLIWLTQRARRLLGLLVLWAERSASERHPKTIFDLPAADRAPGAWRDLLGVPAETHLDSRPDFKTPPVTDDARLEAACRELVALFLRGEVSEAELTAWFDLAALEIEVAPTAGLSAGRYELFETLTGLALTAAEQHAHTVALALCGCHDEGLRWGVAQRMGTRSNDRIAEAGIPNLRAQVAPAEYWTVAQRLIRDGNEWVPRDVLGGVKEVWENRANAAQAWGSRDDAEVARVAEATARWVDGRRGYADAYVADVLAQVEALRTVCPAFGERWWELRHGT